MTDIVRIQLHCLRVPLKVPYALSIAVLEAFDTLLVEVEDRHGASGFGEATVLTGYTDETIAESWMLANELADRLCGMKMSSAIDLLSVSLAKAPFTVTAFTTAIEMASQLSLLRSPRARHVPLVALLHGHGKAELQTEIEQALAEGYHVFKVKVGFEVNSDLARVYEIQTILGDAGMIRIDANQGYSPSQALTFVRSLDPKGIELVEQTCAAKDWNAACAVAGASRVPVMLDESIYGLDDIQRAAKLKAADIIKFKLMKAGGLRKLGEALRRIREFDMVPVLGNGVATDIGCWMEACVASDEQLDMAGEMNGLLKCERGLVLEPLPLERGELFVPAGYWPQLDREALNSCGVQHTERRMS